jgi:TM2 domain-containing membrane protein YozV
VRFCRTCGGDVSTSPQRCPNCGADPLQGTHYCFNCRVATDPFANPCATCGAQLARPAYAQAPQPPPQVPHTMIVNQVGAGMVQPMGPPKSKATAAVLCFFFGMLGVHRFYTGQTGIGVALLLQTLILGPLTLGAWFVVTFIWALIDFILILAGSVTDQYGRLLV